MNKTIGIINLSAALITVIQTVIAGVFAFSHSSLSGQTNKIQMLYFNDFIVSLSPIIRILFFLILELSLSWVFSFFLVVFYLKVQSQVKTIVLLIPGIISAWVSYFNVKFILLPSNEISTSLHFLMAYGFSFVIAVVLIDEHAKRIERCEADQIKLSLSVVQFICFAFVFSVLNSSLETYSRAIS